MPNPFLVLDNSSFDILSCDRRFQNTVVSGLKGADSTTALFGNAFHRATEILDKTSDVTAAMQGVIDKGYQCDELLLIQILTLLKLTMRLPPPLVLAFGQPAIEIKFRYHYKTVETSTFGPLDIDLAGTMDRIHITDQNKIAIVDYKSASDFKDSSQRDKIAQYENSFQLPFYLFSALSSDILPASAKELLLAGDYQAEHIFAFYNAVPPVIKRVVYHYPPEFLTVEVPRIIDHHIAHAVRIWELTQIGQIAPHTGMNVYKACSYCPYRPGCLMHDAAKETEFLTRFTKSTYDPLTFR